MGSWTRFTPTGNGVFGSGALGQSIAVRLQGLLPLAKIGRMTPRRSLRLRHMRNHHVGLLLLFARYGGFRHLRGRQPQEEEEGQFDSPDSPSADECTIPMHSTGDEGSRWFWDHYETAASEVISFLEGDGVSLTGRRVGDIGCGDGIIDLGVAYRAAPAQLVGFDINPTDRDRLAEMAAREGVEKKVPDVLEFRTSKPTTRLPADDDSFDVLSTWSAFEHVGDPTSLLRDMRRILVPDGVLMLQLWPFFHSQYGSHLWRWFPEGFVQLLRSTSDIEAIVRADPKGDPGWAEYMLGEYRTLNRITLDELQRCLLAAGFRVSKLQLDTGPVHIPLELSEHPLSLLGIAGVKLLAVPSDGAD
jgi:SAM-dependent methyltransferase